MTATLPAEVATKLGLLSPGDSAEIEVVEVMEDGSVSVMTEDENESEGKMPMQAPPELRAAMEMA